MRDRLEFLFLRKVHDSFAALPRDQALRRGARLGRVWHAVDVRHRRLAEENIRRGLGVDAATAKRIALANFENLGRNIAEFALSGPPLEELIARIPVEGVEHLDAALDQGKGAFILIGHLGNWELAGACFRRTRPLTALARPFTNPLVDAFVAERRQAMGERTLDPKNATKEILLMLRRGELSTFKVAEYASFRRRLIQ